MFSNPFSREPVYCPVCKEDSRLGYRDWNQGFFGHCDDCKATYHYKTRQSRPYKATLDKDREKKVTRYCSRDGCICH